ncbi:MAG: sulfite exporter TauE/SafE family protein [Chloroflexia bacterium]|nr:sulfite exporter TauE/SafE family protein [Chloroflexia bacterium]
MELWHLGILFFAALVAGAINSVAGGGSFISFPALLLVGVPPITANATNATALWPGSAASVGAYRYELGRQEKGLLLFSLLSLIGGLAGAMLLLRTREAVFTQMIPYLLLLATLVFAFSPWLTAQARRLSASAEGTPMQRFGILGIYLSIAVYGGFFGAGLGILTLAVLSLMGQENIHEMNALKTLQATLINGIAVAAFILAGIVEWPIALIMTLGAIIGGYGGAAIARKLDPRLVRRLVIGLSVSLTIYFFVA